MHSPEVVPPATKLDANLRRLELHDWQLWGIAIVVIVVLCVAMYSFAAARPADRIWLDTEYVVVRSLLAFVLVFVVFACHRQLVINRLRRRLSADMHLLSALQTRTELVHKLAILDPLTGLYNRRFAMHHLPSEMARADRYHHKLTIMAFDLNGLKQINDEHGHAAGDMVIKEFSSALRKAIRNSDFAVRMGGDEFLAIAPECHLGDLPRILGRMNHLSVEHRGQKIEFHYSAGWAEYVPGDTLDQLLDRADQHLYEDKRSGTSEQQGQAARDLRRQTEKLTTMGLLTSTVAHDFNNLLTVIKGYAALMRESDLASPVVQRQAHEIQKAAETAESLTGQLLAFGRKHRFDPRVTNLNEVIRGMETLLRRLVGDHVRVTFEMCSTLNAVKVDSGQMQQVLMNLVANARDAMPTGGELVISAENFSMDAAFCSEHKGARVGEYASISVCDSGIGMDSEVRSHVFEPFFTTKDQGRGTGLGLSTAYGIVKQNGGYISVESEPGRGTKVTVYLPRTAGDIVSIKAREPEVAVRVGSELDATTVLVVQSYHSLRHLICNVVRAEGYDVLEAADCDSAIRMATEYQGRIDAIVADLMMPGMSGIEIVESIERYTVGAKVLYLGGCAEDIVIYREYLPKNTEFMNAPFTPQEFGTRLRKLLSSRVVGLQASVA